MFLCSGGMFSEVEGVYLMEYDPFDQILSRACMKGVGHKTNYLQPEGLATSLKSRTLVWKYFLKSRNLT